MLEHQHTRLMLLRELYDAVTHLMGAVLIKCAYFGPQCRIVLLPLSERACLASVACYPS